MGFCAEHSAVAAMMTHGESVIKKIVSVFADGRPVAACGRCREFMQQINERNLEADVIIKDGKVVKLKDLLPERWDEI